MEILKPNKKLSANVSQLFDLMNNQNQFGNKPEFDEHFDFYVRYSIAEQDGGFVSKQVAAIKDVSNQVQWDRLAKRLFQDYALTTFEIKRDKLMKEFISNLSTEQNEWIQKKIIVMVKEYIS